MTFTLPDVARTLEAAVLFVLLCCAPGYFIASFINAFEFHRRTIVARFAIAVPISICVCPIVAYLLWRVSFATLCVFLAVCALGFLVRITSDCFSANWGVHGRRTYLLIVSGWVVVAVFLLVDLQIGDRLYFPTVTLDYALRTAFTASIDRSGVPGHNPHFFPGRLFGLHYHYFWMILCAAAERLSRGAVSSRQAMIASTVWCGIGFLALIPLYFRFFQSKGAEQLSKRSLVAAGLLAVTGLDLLPVLLAERLTRAYMATIDWWNADQVTDWLDALTWVPHHVAALIACLTGFLLIWDSAGTRDTRRRIGSIPIAGLAFASAAGLSVYVTLAFAFLLLLWIAAQLLRRECRTIPGIISSGLIAAFAAMPFLLELAHTTPKASTSAIQDAGAGFALPLGFHVRTFTIVDIIFGVPDTGWRQTIADALSLPLNYFAEFGFFLIVAYTVIPRILRRNNKPISPSELFATLVVVGTFGICSFVRSTVITNNDFGFRGFMFAQFFLLIWGAELLKDGFLSSLRARRRALVLFTIVVGTLGTVYEAVKIRFYPIQSDTTSTFLYKWLTTDRQLGRRTFAMRKFYEKLKTITPENAVFQHNPAVSPQDNFHGLYADRQLAAEGMNCDSVFGGDEAVCRDRIGEIAGLFNGKKRFDADGIERACHRLSIDVLIAQDTDRVWKDSSSWVWKLRPIVSNDFSRAFACGMSAVEAYASRDNETKDAFLKRR
jgi:hypothetical protein